MQAVNEDVQIENCHTEICCQCRPGSAFTSAQYDLSPHLLQKCVAVNILLADGIDPDQTEQIWVCTGCICHKIDFYLEGLI